MRGKGRVLAGQNKPWFLAVNFVNPHDVMFFDTDAPGTPMKPPPGLAPMARDPDDPLYAKQWDFDFPVTHQQPFAGAHQTFLQRNGRNHKPIMGHK